MRTMYEEFRLRLKPFLQGRVQEDGEQDAHCPLHEDKTRSMRINWKTGQWNCFTGCGGGQLKDLIELMDSRSEVGKKNIQRWHEALLKDKRRLKEFREGRGLNLKTIKEHRLGWDEEQRAYTIPVFNTHGTVYNIRRYRLGATSGKKIWSVKGMGTPRLYPERILHDTDVVVVCEGELDALIALQNGIPAVSGTGGASVWNEAWAQQFKGKHVVVMYDRDDAGERGAARVARSLGKVAASVWVGKIPLKRPGSDVTDLFVKKGWSSGRFRALLRNAQPWGGSTGSVRLEALDVALAETFNAGLAGRTLRAMATVKGKRNPPYLLPQKVSFECRVDKGAKCDACPLSAQNGKAKLSVELTDPLMMRMVDRTELQVTKMLLEAIGARCKDVTLDIKKRTSVEELFVRPSIELMDEEDQSDYTDRKVYSVGRHSTQPNQTVRITGSMLASNVDQRNLFAAWEVSPVESSLDHFEVTKDVVKNLDIFRPEPGMSPLSKLKEIHENMSLAVTNIYERLDLHMAIDLVFHSPLRFKFSGDMVTRGWLECLIIGDTRTGKSEAAYRLTRHYQAGRIISCESASFAGIVGGLQQYGAGREWTITWGAVPLNDRRAVVLDEVSGLTKEQIGQMSSIRSSGIAQLTKIQTEQTNARTRLVWMSNPRKGKIADYTYGVHAISSLIGNPEDIARFDFALSLATDEVDPDAINQARSNVEPRYPSDVCHQRILWAWSRRPEHIRWQRGAEEAVYRTAVKLGEMYIEDPPLVQSANARIKVARIAVALAMATFSASADGENVLVTKQHVEDASTFLNWLYEDEGFGYRAISAEALKDETDASEALPHVAQFIASRPGLGKFLRSSKGSFRAFDIEETLGYTRDNAQQVIATLWKYNMIIRSGQDIRLQPVLHALLRDLKE